MDLVDVVLPCLDEAAALPAVLAAYLATVVDNGSTGLEHATAEIVGFLDADGTLDPGELSDVDTMPDAEQVAGLVPRGRFAAELAETGHLAVTRR